MSMHTDFRRAIMLQYLKQERIVLSIFQVSAPSISLIFKVTARPWSRPAPALTVCGIRLEQGR